jgi:ribosomal protein L15E
MVVAKRQRDYKAEYARRSERAKRQGYSGYSQKRSVQIKAKVFSERLAERLEALGDYFEDESDLYDDSYFWEAFRGYYAKGTTS